MKGRLNNNSAVALAVLACLQLLSAAEAHACACCTNPGDRHFNSGPIEKYERNIIDALRFAETAHLSTGEADPGTILGVKVASARFSLVVRQNPRRWTFVLNDGQGHTGTLEFEIPAKLTRFEVDPHSTSVNPTGGTGPTLYKEWKITSRAVGTGLLRGSVGSGQRATLIFHGRGNHCADASDFNAWTLVLWDNRATVTFFGALLKSRG